MKEAWGKFFFLFLLGKPRLQGQKKWVLSYHAQRTKLNAIIISPSPHPSRYEKSEAQGGGDDGSLMGCIVLFLYLKRLKPLMILVERESQWCFNYSGPSINHGLCVWQLNPSKTNMGTPRPSQSTGWAQQPWSQHTRCTWTPLQSPAATRSATKAGKSQRRQRIPTLQEKKCISGRSRYRDKRGGGFSVCVCFGVSKVI